MVDATDASRKGVTERVRSSWPAETVAVIASVLDAVIETFRGRATLGFTGKAEIFKMGVGLAVGHGATAAGREQ